MAHNRTTKQGLSQTGGNGNNTCCGSAVSVIYCNTTNIGQVATKQQKINEDNIKNIQIRDYLKNRGYYPAREYSGYGMYGSPFRDDSTPSLKVDHAGNLWYDFGCDEGGEQHRLGDEDGWMHF